MAKVKPYLTTDELVEQIERTIIFPISENTFNYNDLVKFLNQEMQLSAVPTLIEEHEEYFVYKQLVPILSNINRYEIPYRAIGLTLRDIKYSDPQGNFYDMTRVAPDDKAFFQQSGASNQALGRFYLEGNEVVFTPQSFVNPQGFLNFFFNLRPNQLVRNDRACIIEGYQKEFTLLNNNLSNGSTTINISYNIQSTSPQYISLVAGTDFSIGSSVAATAGNIAAAINQLNIPNLTATTSAATFTVRYDKIDTTFSVNTASDSIDVNNSDSTFIIKSVPTTNAPAAITIGGTTFTALAGTNYTIGINETVTATNLAAYFTSLGIPSTTFTAQGNTVVVVSSSPFILTNSLNIFSVDFNNLYIIFNQLPSVYIDPVTDKQETLYETNSLVDFLQTNPGHRTYVYDVALTNLDNKVGRVSVSSMMTFAGNYSGGTMVFQNIKVGDYICLQNECIIPQIPPELHHALAERAAYRVLAAIGDREGAAVTKANIAEMDKKQQTLIGSRVESSVPKVFNRYSLLRMGRTRFGRTF